MVRDAFLSCELVRIDCKGLERSDYKKIGCKLRVMAMPFMPLHNYSSILKSYKAKSLIICHDMSVVIRSPFFMAKLFPFLINFIFLNQDLVPCILVTFDKEQIVVWRGKDYQPLDTGYLTVRETFDDVDGNTGCVDDEVVMET